MDRKSSTSRRRFVALTGTALTVPLLAGCAENDETPAPDDETPTPDDETPTPDDETPTPDEDETPTPEENGEPAIDEEWQDVDEIVLEGWTAGWVGVEPAAIEAEENPTLVLVEGREYSITWENMDGQPHDIQLWDEDGAEIVGTEIMDEEGETQTLDFEATAEMVEYICTVHPTTMVGDVEVHAELGD